MSYNPQGAASNGGGPYSSHGDGLPTGVHHTSMYNGATVIGGNSSGGSGSLEKAVETFV